ncbi:hypothetical protein PWG71_17420 [Nocardiopsis sp. N85]|uniref:hypothetical protein n=1 Tax=Nocardiopsis sp. N85 TaxID=3029400 RepID=UPI00237EF022|nr:hypothetical protein [Nocardiopsis sp. N85]MDE3723175.1 hypothetical protein [Nocardiopsis sp. N85]
MERLLAVLGETFSNILTMASSTPIYMGIVGGALALVYWQSHREARIEKNNYKEHLISGLTDEATRAARSEKAKNTPAFLRVADLNNIYLQNVLQAATTIRNAVDNNGQRLANLWSIPFHRKGMQNFLDQKEGRSRVEIFRQGHEEVARRHGVALGGKSVSTRSDPENRRTKM